MKKVSKKICKKSKYLILIKSYRESKQKFVQVVNIRWFKRNEISSEIPYNTVQLM